MGRIVLAVCLSVCSVAAQKTLLVDDPDRQAGVFSVRDLAGEVADEGGAEPVATRLARLRPAGSKDIASLLAGAALRPGDHVESVGPGHVVALGEPDWIGKVEAMLVQMRGAGHRQYQIDTKFCRVSAACMGQLAADQLAGIQDAEAQTDGVSFVLGLDAATKMLCTIRGDSRSQVVQAPHVTARELDRVRIKVGNNITVQRRDSVVAAEERAVASDASVWCGDDATLVFATTSKTRISVSADVASQSVDLHKDVAPVLTPVEANGGPVTVPVVRSCRGFASQEVADGETLVVAAPGSDGSWMVTLVTAEEVWSARIPAQMR